VSYLDVATTYRTEIITGREKNLIALLFGLIKVNYTFIAIIFSDCQNCCAKYNHGKGMSWKQNHQYLTKVALKEDISYT